MTYGGKPNDTTSEQADHAPSTRFWPDCWCDSSDSCDHAADRPDLYDSDKRPSHVHDGYTLYDGVCEGCDPTTAMDLSGWTRSPGVRLAVDAKGYVWRFYPAGSVLGADGDTWSMAPTNPDNSSVPQPVTWYEPEHVIDAVLRDERRP